MKGRLVFAILVACLAGVRAGAEDLIPLRRFALVAGSNDGGSGRVRLKYAESDARSFAAVMEELGGVRSTDLVLAVNPNLSRLQSAFTRVQDMISSPHEGDERRELLIYYSGHSDDEGLILGAERFSWEDLRDRIGGIPADVKVAILDSCSSGSLTRTKGGVARPAFLFDASADMKGHAYLTSSSAEEAAQESDRIGASFFTHFLISGLRGAADTVGDGVVTLNEVYAFAFQETLASTEKTQYGPQHPAYDINLTGSGDLVLTDLRAASAKLRVAEDVGGRLYIRDSRGVLVVELDKLEGNSIELGLTPGTYKVVLDGKSGRLGAQLRISAHQSASLARSALRPVEVDRTTARGPGSRSGTPDPDEASGPSGRPEKKASDPVASAAAAGAAVGAAIGSAVATAITTTVNAVTGGGSAPAAAAEAAQEPDTTASPADGSETSADSGSQSPSAQAKPSPLVEDSTQKFHLSLIPDVSAGLFGSRASHVVTVNLLVGTSSSSRAFEVAGLSNFEGSEMRGFQAAGLSNVVLGDTTGFQTAGLVNVVGGEMRLVQTAGLVNVSLGSGGGAQISGLGNYTKGAFTGAQIGGLGNISQGEIRGIQVAGLFNWSREEVWGGQISGVVNVGSKVNGPQISVVNISDTVSGAQVGVVNIAGYVNGVQIGLLNIAGKIDGVPIGLVSIEERGRRTIDVWYDTDGSVNTAISLGSRYFYTTFSAGWIPDSQPTRWSLGVGLGFRAPLGKLWTDLDVSYLVDQDVVAMSETQGVWNPHPRVRLTLGIPIFGEMALVAGVSVKMTIPDWSNFSSVTYSPAFLFGFQL